MMIIVVIIIISEAWPQFYGKSRASGIELGLRGWDQNIPERRNSVCEGMGPGNSVFSTAAPGRWQWDPHRVHFAGGEFEVLESYFLPQRKRRGKALTKRAEHPAFHGGTLGAPSPLRVSFA